MTEIVLRPGHGPLVSQSYFSTARNISLQQPRITQLKS